MSPSHGVWEQTVCNHGDANGKLHHVNSAVLYGPVRVIYRTVMYQDFGYTINNPG